jgi:arylsulfatase
MESFSRRGFLQFSAASAMAAQPRRPNVVLIMANQMRYDCLGANGNRIIQTPHLDRLAAQSANFQNAFTQAPVSVPSRISLFTGRYPHSHKNRVDYTPCDPREILLQQRLKDAGYQTGAVGKLHYYPPTADHARTTGFDFVEVDDGNPRTDPFSDYVRWRKRHDPNAAVPYEGVVKNPGPGGNPFRAEIDYQYTATAWVGAQTRDLIQHFAGSARPFFVHASFFKPHPPPTVPTPYDSIYNGVTIPLPRPADEEYIHSLPVPVQKQISRSRAAFDLEPRRLEWIYRSYYGAVSMVDHEVGLILEELEKTERAQDTIVIFASDHGDQLLEHGLQGANLFFEASVHIPLMMRFSGRVIPGKYSQMIEAIDVLPSVLELSEIPAPLNCQGRSFASLLTGARGYEARDCVFSENIIPEVLTNGLIEAPFVPGKGVAGVQHPDAKMIRTSRWKLNYYPGVGGELYDLMLDPQELNNLYGDANSQDVVRDLTKRVLDWMITGDENDQVAPRGLL